MYYDFADTEWGRADGTRVRIRDMDVGHLVNVLNWVHDHRARYSDRIREGFVAHAKTLQLAGFMEGKPYPQLVDGRWKVMDPVTGKSEIRPPPADYIEAVKDKPGYQAMAAEAQEMRKKSRNERS